MFRKLVRREADTRPRAPALARRWKLARAAAAIALLVPLAANAETLAQYVSACRTQLNLGTVSVPDMDCYDGDLFATGGSINDFLGYRKVTDQVDLTFACRWLFGSKEERENAVSVELLIHNRQNAKTCFFS